MRCRQHHVSFYGRRSQVSLSAGLAAAVRETRSQQMMPETAVLEQMMDSLMEWDLVTVR